MSFDPPIGNGDNRLRVLEIFKARAEEKLDRLFADKDEDRKQRAADNKAIYERFDTVESRLRSIERNMYVALGAVAVLQVVLRVAV